MPEITYDAAMQKLRIAIIGYGQFGKFIAKHLRPHAIIQPITRNSDPHLLCNCDVVIFSVPYSGLAEAIAFAKPHIKNTTLIVDVTSVKQAPLALLATAFPQNEILGTHPIFGPQSGKNGIHALPIVLCNVSTAPRRYRAIKKFLKHTLMLRVIEQTPKAHDHEMAHIQALTHYIGRALLNMNIKKFATSTSSYLHLIELTELLKNDSWELFKTIELTNPEAKTVRQIFLTQLKKLENDLKKKE